MKTSKSTLRKVFIAAGKAGSILAIVLPAALLDIAVFRWYPFRSTAEIAASQLSANELLINIFGYAVGLALPALAVAVCLTSSASETAYMGRGKFFLIVGGASLIFALYVILR